jgi:hypothetical protein
MPFIPTIPAKHVPKPTCQPHLPCSQSSDDRFMCCRMFASVLSSGRPSLIVHPPSHILHCVPSIPTTRVASGHGQIVMVETDDILPNLQQGTKSTFRLRKFPACQEDEGASLACLAQCSMYGLVACLELKTRITCHYMRSLS